jgi:glycosyltransferase involved in cell wall biosynthesis
MTFAYLILTHKKPYQVLRLVNALTTENTYFIIHIDNKIDETPFRLSIGDRENIFFCKHRKTVNWAGFSQIEATMELIREMIVRIGFPDYVHLLSGQDFPIKSNECIFDYFEKNRGTNFIEYFSLPSDNWNDGMERIRYKWYIDDVGYAKATELVQKQKPHDFLPNIVPYGGSTWWSLTGECVANIFNECNQGSQLYEFYKYTVSPDEMLFHTFLMNSEYKNTIKNYNLRKIDWSAKLPHPKTWQSEHFEELINSPRLFARKFDADFDSEILNKLETHIINVHDCRKVSKTPAVSVVMSMYNAREFLRECIDSILNQSFSDFELIIADDGSTDDSVEIVKSYDDKRIKLVLCEHNFINSLNTGLSHAKGKYIARMDSDDIMPVERLEVQFEFMEQHLDIDICVGWMQFFGNSTHLEKVPANHNEIAHRLIYRNFVMSSSAMLRRAVFNNIKFDDDYFYVEDYKLWIDSICAGYHFSGMQKVLNCYRTHNNQLTVTKSMEMSKKAFKVRLKYIEYLMETIVEKNEKYFTLIDSLIKATNENLISANQLIDIVGNIYKEFFDKESYRETYISIKKYLTDNYKNIIGKYQNITDDYEANMNIDESPVWICWWDGEEAMPDIVNACFKSVCNNAGIHPVKLITKYNYLEFTTIPDYIIDKVDKNIISITHLADILRMCLLYEHGGLWIDSTVFVSAEFKPYLFEQDFFTVRNSSAISFDISEYKWTSFCIGGKKRNLFFAFMRDMFYEYWKKEEKLIHYFLLDYCISIAYDEIPLFRNMIEKIPYSNPQIYNIVQNFYNEFDRTVYEQICLDTDFHKLTWKQKFSSIINGKQTFYGYILSNYK